jgi:hypothetical protein
MLTECHMVTVVIILSYVIGGGDVTYLEVMLRQSRESEHEEESTNNLSHFSYYLVEIRSGYS